MSNVNKASLEQPRKKRAYRGTVQAEIAAMTEQRICSQLEERLILWLEYHPQVKSYVRGDIGSQFASIYRLPLPKHAPFAIGYTLPGISFVTSLV